MCCPPARAHVLINTEMGSEDRVTNELNKIEEVKEVYGVYGVYDLVVRVEAETLEKLKKARARWRYLGFPVDDDMLRHLYPENRLKSIRNDVRNTYLMFIAIARARAFLSFSRVSASTLTTRSYTP